MAKYITVVDTDGETDALYCDSDTPDAIHEAITKHARRVLENNEELDTYTFCAVDFDRNVSIIYEFTCERKIVLECTMY